MNGDDPGGTAKTILKTPELADALASDRFKQILDFVPVGIIVAKLSPTEVVVYANPEFERLTGDPAAAVVGGPWDVVPALAKASDGARPLATAITEDSDHLGVFALDGENGSIGLEAWSTIIEDDDGKAVFRVAALAPRKGDGEPEEDVRETLAKRDFQLRELQHRVKNNLQLITSLIRIEARGLRDSVAGARFDSLAGRIEALAVLYRSLTESGHGETVDLGVYLGEIATSVVRSNAVPGIHLDLQVDTWPVSINVAMPVGLVVNELLTNSLKHAFVGRGGGSIELHSLVDEEGCRVTVADDGVGLPDGVTWPSPGKLSALFVRSLRQNAKADIQVESSPGRGVRVKIVFEKAEARP
jgi:two-component sensor histidine kinase